MLRLSLVLMLIAAAVPGFGQSPASVWEARMPPVEQHPCLMFGAKDLPRIRKRLERPPFQSWWQRVRKQSGMVSQAFTYAMTGEKEKAEAVRRQLLRCYPTGYHCSCGVANALQGMAEAYDLVFHYEGLTQGEHRIIRTKIAHACERLFLSALETGAGQHPGNQRTRGICALGTAAIVLKGYEDAAHTPLQWLQRALDGIRQEANLAFWRDDGMFIEGPGYSSFTLSVMTPFARYYGNASGKWLFDDPRLRNGLLYLVYITQPDGQCAALGTTNMSNVVNSLTLCLGAGPPRDQALFRWALAQWGNPGGGVRFLGLFDDSVQPSPSGVPVARFFPVSQEASLRSQWSSGAVALWFKGKDPWLARTHRVYSHADVGGFVVHAYGELLAVDAGYDHWVSYNLYPPELHNTLLVDGQGPASETPGLLENAVDAGFLQAGDIVADYCGVRHRRTFILVDGQYVVVADDILAEEEHDYAWQVHTPVSRETGQVTIAENRASWTGFNPATDEEGSVAIEVSWAGPVSVESVATSRWQPWSPSPTTGSYDNWAVVARQHAADARYLTTLCPRPPQLDPLRVETPAVQGGRCIVVNSESTKDTILITEGSSVTFGKITTDARTCVLRERAGQLEWIYLAGSGRIEYDGTVVADIAAPADGVVAFRLPSLGGGGTASGASSLRVHVSGAEDMQLRLPAASRLPARFARNAGGEWRPLPAPRGDTSLLRLSADLVRDRTVVLCGRSKSWVPQPETMPPTVTAVSLDGNDLAPQQMVDIGRVAGPPNTLRVEMTDTASALDPASLRVTCDGARQTGNVRTSRRNRTMAVDVDLSGVSGAADHEVVLSLTDEAPTPNPAQFAFRFSMSPLVLNGSFEAGGDAPRGWSLGSWSNDAKDTYDIRAVSDRPRSGEKCLLMRVLDGPVNVIASQSFDCKVGQTYILTGHYRGDVSARASVCSGSGEGQYLWSPSLGPSEEWIPFSWEFTTENPETPLVFALRLANKGNAYFDDIELEEKRP